MLKASARLSVASRRVGRDLLAVRSGRCLSVVTSSSGQESVSHELSAEECLQLDRKHVMHPYTSMTDPLPTHLVRGAKGPYLEFDDGKQLIDGMSSWWAALHGYCHPELDAAVKTQLDSMSHVMFGGLTHRPAVELAKLLVELTPEGLDKVFLCDSGSVAMEVSMKMAVQYWYTLGKPDKSKFVSLRNGYHGDTFGVMSVCDPVNGMHSMFSGMLAQQLFSPRPEGPSAQDAYQCAAELRKVLEANHHNVAAVVFEPIVQGAGGMRFFSPVLLREARKLCDEFDVLLIFDEIATGFSRTGTMFACQHTTESYQPWYAEKGKSSEMLKPLSDNQGDVCDVAVVPDILALGKALTGGYMTLSAAITNQRVSEGISGGGGVFMHGPTYMGNPLACAVAHASLSLLKKSPWQERVRVVHNDLCKGLAPLTDLPQVSQVRALGAIGVCELHEPVQDMAATQNALIREGVWLRPFGKLLYTMPTFNAPAFTSEHVAKICRAIYAAAKMQ